MKHHGEIIKKRVVESGLSVNLICERAGFSSATMYRLYHLPQVQIGHLMSIGKAINHDFSEDIPELREFVGKENLEWKFKYLELADKFIKLMEERDMYKSQLEK